MEAQRREPLQVFIFQNVIKVEVNVFYWTCPPQQFVTIDISKVLSSSVESIWTLAGKATVTTSVYISRALQDTNTYNSYLHIIGFG